MCHKLELLHAFPYQTEFWIHGMIFGRENDATRYANININALWHSCASVRWWLAMMMIKRKNATNGSTNQMDVWVPETIAIDGSMYVAPFCQQIWHETNDIILCCKVEVAARRTTLIRGRIVTWIFFEDGPVVKYSKTGTTNKNTEWIFSIAL